MNQRTTTDWATLEASKFREYGLCLCGGKIEERQIELRLREEVDQLQIPQGSCARCGARYYKAELLARIEATFQGRTTDPILRAPLS